MSDVQIVVPFGGDDPQRLRILDWIVARYRRLHPGWPVTVTGCDGDWSKGRAVNSVAASLDAEVTIFADADSYVTPDALHAAVDRVADLGWSMPHGSVRRIAQADTLRILDGEDVPDPAPHARTNPALPGGGIVVLDRRARGILRNVIFDPRFVGWGYEDRTLSLLMGHLLGHYPTRQIPAQLWHLWHPPAPNHHAPSKPNRLLYRRYRDARLDRDALTAILEEVDPCR